MALFDDLETEKIILENMKNENNSSSIVHDHLVDLIENSCKTLQKNAEDNQLLIIFFG